MVTGVDYYKNGTAVFPVYFPEGKADCRHCPYIRNVEHLGLLKCCLTEALVERSELNERHPTCPVVFVDEEETSDG